MDSILIIDDEPQIRKLLSRMMELEGYEVFQAADCQSTLKQLKLYIIPKWCCVMCFCRTAMEWIWLQPSKNSIQNWR